LDELKQSRISQNTPERQIGSSDTEEVAAMQWRQVDINGIGTYLQ
jgi:hypothetical protein